MYSLVTTLLIHTSFSPPSSQDVAKCIIGKNLYHIQSSTCVPPLSSNPCPDGEWVVHGLTSGTGVCASQIECSPGKTPVLTMEGGVQCSCPHGTYWRNGYCHSLGTQADCQRGKVLIPENIQVGKRLCSANFSCIKIEKCPSYRIAKIEMAKRRLSKKADHLKYIKEMICDKEGKYICCPKTSKESLFHPEILLASLLPQKAICRRSPCSAAEKLWLNEREIVKCIKDAKEHERAIVDKNVYGKLDRYARILEITETCGRRRTWKFGRCVRIF